MTAHHKNLPLATFLILVSFFSLSATNAIVKMINNRLSPFQILLVQCIFGTLIMFFICIFSQKKSFFKSKHYGLLFIRGVIGLFGFLFVFISVPHLSVANATLLLNTGPFFIPFFLLAVFKEPIDRRVWLGIIPGFIGVLLILKPGVGLFQWYALLPLLSGICIATVFTVLKKLHEYKEPMLRILFYLFFFGGIFISPLGIYKWKWPAFEEGVLLAISCITSFLSGSVFTIGLKYGSPKALAPMCYTSVVFAILFDWVFWQNIPTWTSFLGIALVVIGGIIALVIENQKRTNVKAQKVD